MRKKLYIASWGNPLAWRRVKYQCNGNVRESISSIVCAEADKYVIYVQDSVITAVIKSASNDLNEVVDAAKKAGLRVERRQLGNNEEIVVKPEDCSKWREAAARYIKEVAHIAAPGIDVSVVVAPAMGRYGSWTYHGYPDLVLAQLLLQLWQEVEALGQPASNDGGSELEIPELEIHLDLTHGVNYMPTLLLHAARLISNIALAYGYSKVILRAYNAVPDSWQYIKVYSEEFQHIIFSWTPRLDRAKALYYGALLHLAKMCNDVKKPIFETYIQCEGNEVHYKGIREAELETIYEQLLVSVICSSETPRTLKQLMRWHLVDKLPPTARAIIRNELNDIWNALASTGLAGGDKIKLRDLYEKAHRKGAATVRAEEKAPCADDNRNFIAHAGLLNDYTYITANDGDYLIDVDLEATLDCLKK